MSNSIVAETAARIFADLADPQAVNSARDDAWKTPLWQALSDAGLTLAWVPEEQGGAGAELADGFAVLGVAGRVCGGHSAGRNTARRLAAVARRADGAAGRDVGRAGAAGRHHHAEFRRNAERPRARRSRSPGRRSISRCWPGGSVALVETAACRLADGINLAERAVKIPSRSIA